MKILKANDAKDVFEMETSTKEIDKACKLMNEAILILRKWEAALAVKSSRGRSTQRQALTLTRSSTSWTRRQTRRCHILSS